jgi:imidazole glycerol phosphate synthase glutamine amidotransferase subunit
VKVALIDHGAGNVASVERALQRLDAPSLRVQSADGIRGAEAIILPGVGHFSSLIRALDEHGLRDPLREALARDVPFLGICLGLQALYDSSEEAPEFQGLRVVSGNIHSLPTSVKLPHMGWNQVTHERPSRLLEGIPLEAYFYFAHSYAALTNGAEPDVASTCTHGAQFVAVLERENLCAVQFHPEKSGAPGVRLLQNFVRMAS